MIYNIDNNNYNDFRVIEKNRLSARAFFVPFSNQPECHNIEIDSVLKNSKRVINLNGKWEFKFFSHKKLPKKIDTQKIKFDSITVPSCWQLNGYEKPLYLKERYAFNCQPPHVPTQKSIGLYSDGKSKKLVTAFDEYNSTAVYRKNVEIKNLTDKTFILSFLGVSACFDLYVNGKFVGYSQGSFNTAEFDITDYSIIGTNEIVVVLRKWCSGSYLESQDMFRLSGIFRDVLLFVNNKTFIYDFCFNTMLIDSPNKYQFNLNVKVQNFKGHSLRVILADCANKVVYQSDTQLNTEEIIINYQDNFQAYSAEKPDLYKLYLILLNGQTVTECVYADVGFKDIKITNDKLFYNDKPIKLKGIVYNEWHKTKGYSIPLKDMQKDIALMKEYNINAVRLTVPPHPLFVQLCNLAGLYLVVEAALDTSGTAYSPFFRPNMISRNKKWSSHFIDRVDRMYHSLKNQASIIMWGLGSSSGGMSCQDYCYDYLKRLTNLPIYYDGEISSRRNLVYDITAIKSCSVKQLYNIARKKLTEVRVAKPILLTEYVTVSGTCGGGLKDYINLINSNDCIVGGFVKSFADKTFYTKGQNYQYNYGSDSQTFIDDGIYCVNGIFDVDRKAYITAENLRYLYRPFTARLIDNKAIEITNNNYFLSSNGTTVLIEVLVEGQVVSQMQMETEILPSTSQKFDILIENKHLDIFLNVKYLDKKNNNIIALEQFCLNEAMIKVALPAPKNIEVKESSDQITVVFDKGFIKMDKVNGGVLNYNYDGVELLENKSARMGGNCFATNIQRQYTAREKAENGNLKFEKVKVITKNLIHRLISDQECGHKVEVICNSIIYIENRESYTVQDVYVIYPNGKMNIFCCLHPKRKNLQELKCFGKLIKMPMNFNQITYYAQGATDNYIDINQHALMGIYTTTAENFSPSYALTQEQSNRCQTRYAIIKNKKGYGLMFNALHKSFNLKVRTHPKQLIDSSLHQEQLGEHRKIYIQINDQLAGVGTLDKPPRKKYKIMPKDSYIINFEVIPLNK